MEHPHSVASLCKVCVQPVSWLCSSYGPKKAPNSSHSVLSTPTCNQNWYAEDSACTTDLDHLSEWFEKLCLMGPKYVYYPEPKKTVLVVDKEYDSEAHAKFDHLGDNIFRGHRFLGGFIGNVEATNQFVEDRVKVWTNLVTTLSDTAKSYPQATFVDLSNLNN